ncbi:hypothetical protein [Neorhodopirellula lusitana]|uniref:hypothetical protein n=1 Tax=Neorhodopirellula lusitana TaxID=445327 RepID=UPI0024B70043|nr:hypothetical protein [Neorhodopirellula lusitana]
MRLLVLAMPLLVGCDGCRLTDEGSEAADGEVVDRPAFTSRAAQAYPISRADAGTGGALDGAAKPGHWMTVGFGLRSNQEDRRGTVGMHAKADVSSGGFAGQTEPEEADSIDSVSLSTQRPVVLPKGQLRRFDTRLLAPMRGGQTVETIGLAGEYSSTDSTHRFSTQPSQLMALQAQTYFFVVLTDRAERFARLQTADWVQPYQNEFAFFQARDNYRIVIPPTNGIIPLAETALDWTSTAVLLWDDLPVRALTSSQVKAIVDWLHFGGTLIVNGPAAAESLNDKAFRDYVPIQFNGNEELRSEDARQLVRSHSVKSDQSLNAILARLDDDASRIAVAGTLRSDVRPIGEGGLLVERRVGRGRLVQSRVDLMSEWLTAWKSYDSFWNSAVLARPPRVFHKDEGLIAEQRAVAGAMISDSLVTGAMGANSGSPDGGKLTDDDSGLPPLRQTFVGMPTDETHPAINTGVRWLSRDTVLFNPDVQPAGQPAVQPDSEGEPVADAAAVSAVNLDPSSETRSALSPWIDSTLWTHPVSGLGGWKDDSPLVTWSRQALAGEVGLAIPDSKLVFRSLMIYLIVLIPCNYLFFRLLGRLEWAWLAVVPLSILGALYVARAAQLDVGFARSRNEIAFLEVPQGYERGHLTRVMGLYNSLASRYQIQFDDPDAAIGIVQAKAGGDADQGLFGAAEPELRFGYEAGMSLEGVSVGSNAYRAVHVEQFVELGGAIELQGDAPEHSVKGPFVLVNQSELDLKDVHVARSNDANGLDVVEIGDLSAGVKKTFRLGEDGVIQVDADSAMNVDDAMARLLAKANVERGEIRLVGRVDSPLPGVSISPDTQQVRGQTIVVVHLRYRPTVQPTPDANLIGDFRRRQTTLPGDEK